MSSFVFDHETAKNLRELSPGRSFRFESGSDHFSFALQRERCVLVVPALEDGKAAVMEVRRTRAASNSRPIAQISEPKPSEHPTAKRGEARPQEQREELREPRGILGLDGDAVYLDEEELQDQRPWWQRLFRS